MILGVLVWKKLITLKQAKKVEGSLGHRTIPPTIEKVVEQLKEASK